LQRQAAGLSNSTLDGFDQFLQADLAIVEFTDWVANSNDGASRRVLRIETKRGQSAPVPDSDFIMPVEPFIATKLLATHLLS
jgi:hypothetical protein